MADVRSTRAARWTTTLLALVLLLPVLGLPLQDEQALARFHNRSLVAWPPAARWVEDPVANFAQARQWLADRVFPIVQAATLHKQVLLQALDTAPQRRITMGQGGFIFLNGSAEDRLYDILDDVCVKAHDAAAFGAFQRALPGMQAFGQRHGMAIDILIVPTSATLYGGYLPATLPSRLRQACQDDAVNASALSRASAGAAPLWIYPRAAMVAQRQVPGFYPPGNWHADGLSVKVARDAYLHRLGVPLPQGEQVQPIMAPSELLATYGIDWPLPMVRVASHTVQGDAATAAAMRQQVAGLFDVPVVAVQGFRNVQPVLDQSVLMLSDSFGGRSAAVFAGAFGRLVQVNLAGLHPSRVGQLILQMKALQPADRVILMVQEGNLSLVTAWAQAIGATP